MSHFPKNSAFDRGHHESEQEFHDRIAAPVNPMARQVRTASIHVSSLEEWAGELEYIVSGMRDDADALAVERVVDSIRSHFPG